MGLKMHKLKISVLFYIAFTLMPIEAISNNLSDSALTQSIILKGEVIFIGSPSDGEQSNRWTVFRYNEKLYGCRFLWDILPNYFDGQCVQLQQVEYR